MYDIPTKREWLRDEVVPNFYRCTECGAPCAVFGHHSDSPDEPADDGYSSCCGAPVEETT